MIDRIKELLPEHYREYAPRFIIFLQKYYEWLYRRSGLSQNEINDLTSDTSWLHKDIDKFISSGRIKFLDANPVTNLDNALVELNNTANPGRVSDNLMDNFFLENNFKGFLDRNAIPINLAKDTSVEFPTTENAVLDSWFASMGSERFKRRDLTSLNNIDEVLMLSLLKHVYAIKGTETSIRLFFTLFFDEDILIYYPKLDIAVLDENFILENVNSILRDDDKYQEFSYVITTIHSWSVYKQLFENIFIKNIHPAGFRYEVKAFDGPNNRIRI